jgi:uncharacterized protein
MPDEFEPLLRQVDHRPWSLPQRAWIMTQTWHDLLFAHWAVAPAMLRARVPAALDLDLWEGKAYVAVAPFRMSGVRPRRLPGLPGHTAFPELNVRTYVTFQGRPGVFFFSLDALSWAAVKAARLAYRLPYYRAEMSVEGVEEIRYASRRLEGPQPAEFRGRYRPVGPVERRAPGTLPHFLTERYCLYSVDEERVYRGEIHHAPWPLQDAAAEIEKNTMAASAGITLGEEAPLLHFARELKVLIWAIERVG